MLLWCPQGVQGSDLVLNLKPEKENRCSGVTEWLMVAVCKTVDGCKLIRGFESLGN